MVTLSSPPSRDLIKLAMVAETTLQQRFCDVTMQHRTNVGNVNERNKILAGTLHKLDLNVFFFRKCNVAIQRLFDVVATLPQNLTVLE